jgi:ATP-dependent Clp protease ATP-binding subunit ClpA
LDRLIQDKIKDPLADALLFGDLKQGGEVNVVMKGNEPEIKSTKKA